jgi:hypothetical protein
MPTNSEDWGEYRRLIIESLDRIESKIDDMDRDIHELKTEQEIMRRASVPRRVDSLESALHDVRLKVGLGSAIAAMFATAGVNWIMAHMK